MACFIFYKEKIIEYSNKLTNHTQDEIYKLWLDNEKNIASIYGIEDLQNCRNISRKPPLSNAIYDLLLCKNGIFFIISS